jgi:hypothetical protein
MRISRCLFVVALIFGLSGLAKADADFHMTVLDPPTALDYTLVDGSPFDVTFSSCPANIVADGCFTGYNDTTDLTFTSLDIAFSDTGGLGGQNATCDTSSSQSLFADSTCTSPTPANDMYNLLFFGGSGIAPGQLFFIAETGVAPEDFPSGTATVGVTPEPSSIVLLATGIGMLGLFFVNRRRVAGQASRF